MRQISGIRKKPYLALFLFGLASMTLSSGASAGVWKGIVSYGGSPAAGATVSICNVAATTNNSGRFRISVSGNDKSCPLKVSFQGKISSEVRARLRPYLSLSLRSSSAGWVVEVK